MTDSNTLTRLDNLERQNRRLRRMTMLLALCVTAFGILGARRPDAVAATDPGTAAPEIAETAVQTGGQEVRAQRFVLVDADGAELGTLGVDAKGFPMLLLRKDKASAVLTLNNPSLALRGDDGRRGAWIGQDTKQGMGLSLNGPELTNGLRMNVKADGSSGLFILDDGGRDALVLERLADGAAAMSARDGDGVPRSYLGLTAEGIPSLVLLDDRGAKRAGLAVQPNGAPLLSLDDERGQARIELSERFDGHARLRTFDSAGKTTFETP